MADLFANVNKKEIRSVYVTTSADTSGTTVGLYMVGGDGTANLVGSTAGVVASTQMTIIADWTLTPGWYKVEAVSDVGGTNPQTIWPDEDDQEFLVNVREVAAIA